MKDQSGSALRFREVRGERGEGKAGQLYEVRGGGPLCERERQPEIKYKENGKKPREKCADCNLSENGNGI